MCLDWFWKTGLTDGRKDLENSNVRFVPEADINEESNCICYHASRKSEMIFSGIHFADVFYPASDLNAEQLFIIS